MTAMNWREKRREFGRMKFLLREGCAIPPAEPGNAIGEVKSRQRVGLAEAWRQSLRLGEPAESGS
ncbi:MAG: hypothetical protein LC742_00010 [Acidobacteria bacterium]|nr:hypothetical protein [Acidobacteriota bacterium]